SSRVLRQPEIDCLMGFNKKIISRTVRARVPGSAPRPWCRTQWNALVPNAMKPDIQCVRTHWIRSFMPLRPGPERGRGGEKRLLRRVLPAGRTAAQRGRTLARHPLTHPPRATGAEPAKRPESQETA